MLSGYLSISFMEILFSYRHFEKILDVVRNPEHLFATFGKWNAEMRYLSKFCMDGGNLDTARSNLVRWNLHASNHATKTITESKFETQ